jgi:hypothetical protein
MSAGEKFGLTDVDHAQPGIVQARLQLIRREQGRSRLDRKDGQANEQRSEQ